MSTGFTCSLSLFTWTCVEREGRKEVVPLCPTHASSQVRFNTFGTGIIVTCHEEGNHLVKLCERDPFESEKQEATRILLIAKAAAAPASED